jgi:hypothetical protein
VVLLVLIPSGGVWGVYDMIDQEGMGQKDIMVDIDGIGLM